MKPPSPALPTFAELVDAPAASAPPAPAGRRDGAPRNTATQRRMAAKQPASGATFHARHHVSRQTQS